MKLYEREGRRFVAATDHTGHYLNYDGTISETKTEKSIAICVLHTVSEMIFCELNDNPPRLNWNDAKKYCSEKFLGNGRLPEIHELLMARNCFKNIFSECGFVWSNMESSHYYARGLYLGYGYVADASKDSRSKVFAFLTIKLYQR